MQRKSVGNGLKIDFFHPQVIIMDNAMMAHSPQAADLKKHSEPARTLLLLKNFLKSTISKAVKKFLDDIN